MGRRPKKLSDMLYIVALEKVAQTGLALRDAQRLYYASSRGQAQLRDVLRCQRALDDALDKAERNREFYYKDDTDNVKSGTN